jgi:hypothetical protein
MADGSALPRTLPLPKGTIEVKVENGFAIAQDGALSFHLFDLSKAEPESIAIVLKPADLDVVSLLVQDFSLSPDGVFFVSAYANFGLGDSRYALVRYEFQAKDAVPVLRHLPDIRCRFLAAGIHGVWCLDPDPRETRNQPPQITWVGWLGTMRSYRLSQSPGVSLGPPRVIAGINDTAQLWWPTMRLFGEFSPVDGVVAATPIPTDPNSRALTSFAVSPTGRVHALLPLRGDRAETLTTPYALAELSAKRDTWRRLLPSKTFVRGALLAGWSADGLWIWNRTARALERIDGVDP